MSRSAYRLLIDDTPSRAWFATTAAATLLAVVLVACPPTYTAPEQRQPLTPRNVEAEPAPVVSQHRPRTEPGAPLVSPEQKRRAVEWAKRRAREEAERQAQRVILDALFGD